MSITGYQMIEELYDSGESRVLRAIRDSDQLPVVLKILKEVQPGAERLNRFKHEHRIVKELDLPGVVRSYELCHIANHWLIVEEDFAGESLSRLGLSGRLTVAQFLEIAERICRNVASLHQRSVIHKDLNPSNIVMCAQTGEIKLIDFGISTQLSRECVPFTSLRQIEATLAYVAPEQTGRLSEALDERADLYALGCTFYELLSGSPPFEASDIAELVHCHLAKEPRFLSEVNSAVPKALSEIIARLLQKNSADRYQSAAGLQADLERLRDAQQQGETLDSFELGKFDFPRRIVPPTRLHGRDTETRALAESFDRVARGGFEYAVVCGHAGVGKSALVKNLCRIVSQSKGTFAAGKFDKLLVDRPYGPVLDALDTVLTHMLTEPVRRVEVCAEKVKRAAGRLLPALVAVLPRLELLQGRLPPIAPLLSDEVQHGFLPALVRVIGALATAEQPLILFIDDLHWADGATLDLLQHLALAADTSHLLIVGAYRDNEVPLGHPLQGALKQILETGRPVRELRLEPLSEQDSASLLADMLRRNRSELSELALAIHRKTLGNPLFVQALLDALLAKGVIFFDDALPGFNWHIDKLRAFDASDGVVELLLEGIRRLPWATQDLLRHAACIGSTFELGLLAHVLGRSHREVAQLLLPAIAGNYLSLIEGDARMIEDDADTMTSGAITYKFAHDRVQQAAYDLVGNSSNAEIHLRIGRALRTYESKRFADSGLLTRVNQLNRAHHLLEGEAERQELVELNLAAGKQAREAVAARTALEYFECGLRLLGRSAEAETNPSAENWASDHERAFHTRYSVALELGEGAAEAAYLVADFARVEQHAKHVLAHAGEVLDRVKTVQTQINARFAQYQLREVIALAREALEPLGVSLPESPVESDIEDYFSRVLSERQATPVEALADLAGATDARACAALRILNSVSAAAFLAQPSLAPIVAANMVLIALRHGLGEQSANGFVYYGMALCGQGYLAEGYAYGCLAEKVTSRSQRKLQIPELAVLGSFYIFHWRRPVNQSVQLMRDGYRAGIETGVLGAAVNCLQASSAMAFLAGRELESIDNEYGESAEILRRLKQGPYLTWLCQYRQAVQNFRGLNEIPTRLQGEVYDEVESLPLHQQSGDQTAIYMLNFNKLILAYHFGEGQLALNCARALEGGNQPGSVLTPVVIFYECLALLAGKREHGEEQRAIARARANSLVERMKKWGDGCPSNYSHKYHLMAAELARFDGRNADAREHYDLAADLAGRHEFVQEEGLALERAALFYRERGNIRLARHYMRDAEYAYRVWGGAAKCRYLRKHYGHLLDDDGESRSMTSGPIAAGARGTTKMGQVELAAVMKATQALRPESDAKRGLQALMRAALESAGADTGAIIVARDEQLIVRLWTELDGSSNFAGVSLGITERPFLAHQVVQFVARSGRQVVLGNACEDGPFVSDPYIRQTRCKSILCLPIIKHGTLVAVSYLQNSRTAFAFSEDRLAIIALLMEQAALSLEDPLHAAHKQDVELGFRVGGSLPADSPVYVRRRADELLVDNVKNGELSYVLNTRQMGKSSLRVRAVDELSRTGVACVSIDLTSIGSSNVTIEQWYAGIARALINGLGLDRDVDLRSWWREHADYSAVQRLDLLIDRVILARVERSIAVFVDEVDAVLGLSFAPDDFFALMRQLYNRRADDARYRRLTFVLLGVASPTDLTRDKRRTPFNVGRAVPLTGFQLEEARTLIPPLATVGDGEKLLRAILDWTGGQPFLTQKLCRLVVEEESRPPVGREEEWVADAVRRRIISKWRQQDEPEHLRTIETRILHASRDVAGALALYRRILCAGEIDAEESLDETNLLLSGLVSRSAGRLRVGSRIYAEVFDLTWIGDRLVQSLEQGSVPQ